MTLGVQPSLARELLRLAAIQEDAWTPEHVREISAAIGAHGAGAVIGIARRAGDSRIRIVIASGGGTSSSELVPFENVSSSEQWLRAAAAGSAPVDSDAPEAPVLTRAGVALVASAPIPSGSGVEARLLLGRRSAMAPAIDAFEVASLARFLGVASMMACGELPDVVDFDRLVRQDSFAILGKLSGGLVHEVNNPATFIVLAVGQLEKLLSRSPHAQELEPAISVVREIGESVGQMRAVVADFQLLASVARSTVGSSMDLARLLRSSAVLASVAYRTQAHIDIDLGDLGDCPASFASLGPVVVHLLVNAIQAIPQRESSAHRITLSAHVTDETLKLTVHDTGPGIPAELVARAGDPFLSTRDPDQAAGLGLAMARHTVEKLGGTLAIDSAPGAGTRVEVTLPLCGPVR